MEKNSDSPIVHNNNLRRLLTLGALSVTLSTSTPKAFSQMQQTKSDLIENVDTEQKQDPQNKLEAIDNKNFFITNFAKIVNHVKDIKDFPYTPRYKNPEVAKKYGFPSKIDISPKILNVPKDSVVVTLGDKMYEITPFFGKQIMGRKILSPDGLDEPKVVLTLKWSESEIVDGNGCKRKVYKTKSLIISSREFAQYIYDINKVPEGGHKMFITYLITVREISKKNSQELNKNNLAQTQ